MCRASATVAVLVVLLGCPHDFDRPSRDAGDGGERDGGCAPGLARCSDGCADTFSDPSHCGGCGKACAAGQDCAAGVCACVRDGRCAGCCDGLTCVPIVSQTLERCGHAGLACVSCDDGKTCTTDACETGSCKHAIDHDSCLIDGSCRAEGDADLAEPRCNRCLPGLRADAWSVAPISGCVRTLAGTGKQGYLDGPGRLAMFKYPAQIALSADEATLYVADSHNNRIRTIALGSEVVTTVAGSGGSGYKDGPVAQAELDAPAGIAIGAGGDIYVADTFNHVIRRIHAGQVTLFAGAPDQGGNTDGPLADARFQEPIYLFARAGVIYFSDYYNNRIRTIAGGQVSIYAGTGAASNADGALLEAGFRKPAGLAMDAAGRLVIADRANNLIRRIDGAQVTTIAGTGVFGYADGPADQAAFGWPEDVAVHTDGTIYVADIDNNAIREIVGGQVRTVAGGKGLADGPIELTRFYNPSSVEVGSDGTIYVSDTDNHRICAVHP